MMGIQEREYVRRDRRREWGASRFRMRGLSVTLWIIIINVAVFVLDALLMNAGLPVYRGEVLRDGPKAMLETGQLSRSDLRIEPVYRLPNGAEAQSSQVHNAGMMLVKRIATEDGAVVGRRVYRVFTPLRALGHFSTWLGFQRLEVWRLVTFQFLHGGIWHLLLNMYGLWVFGTIVEQYLGRKRYAAFYLVCGICGGLAYLLLSLLESALGLSIPGRFENPTTPLIGASAGVFGVIVASAYIAPHAIVQLLFPPIPLRLKWFAYGYVAIAAFFVITGGRNAGGEAAHLGGAIAGFFFIRNAHLLRDFFDVLGNSRKAPRTPTRASGKTADEEVDRILAKVGTQGIASLTEKERKILRKSR